MCFLKQTLVQACTEMVMPMTVSNESMFRPSSFSYEKMSESCLAGYRVRPRMHWITSEYGGHVSFCFRFSVFAYEPLVAAFLCVACAHLVLHCTTHCRKLTKFSRGLGATSSSPTGCETRGVEGGKSKRFHYLNYSVASFNHSGIFLP